MTTQDRAAGARSSPATSRLALGGGQRPAARQRRGRSCAALIRAPQERHGLGGDALAAAEGAEPVGALGLDGDARPSARPRSAASVSRIASRCGASAGRLRRSRSRRRSRPRSRVPGRGAPPLRGRRGSRAPFQRRVAAREVLAHVSRRGRARGGRRTPRGARSRRRSGPRGRARRGPALRRASAAGPRPGDGRRSPGPRECAHARAPSRGREDALGPGQVFGGRDLAVPRRARHRGHDRRPRRSTAIASSVSVTRSRKACLVGAHQQRETEALRRLGRRRARARSRVSTTRPSRTRFTVSTTGEHGQRRPVLRRGRATTPRSRATSTKGRAASWTSTTPVEAVRRLLQALEHRVLAPRSRRPSPRASLRRGCEQRRARPRPRRRAPRPRSPPRRARPRRRGRPSGGAVRRRARGRPWAATPPCAPRAPRPPGWRGRVMKQRARDAARRRTQTKRATARAGQYGCEPGRRRRRAPRSSARRAPPSEAWPRSASRAFSHLDEAAGQPPLDLVVDAAQRLARATRRRAASASRFDADPKRRASR